MGQINRVSDDEQSRTYITPKCTVLGISAHHTILSGSPQETETGEMENIYD